MTPDLFGSKPENEPQTDAEGVRVSIEFVMAVRIFLRQVSNRELHYGEIVVDALELRRKYGI